MNRELGRKLYETNEVAKAVIDHFGALSRSRHEFTTDQIVKMVENPSISRWDSVKTLKLMAELGYGFYTVGRRGHVSRFRFSDAGLEFAKELAGTTRIIDVPLKNHRHVEVKMPINLTGRETRRVERALEESLV